jgi:D-3-phosphoglycerate dehydrogenase
VNLPQVAPPQPAGAFRTGHLHVNVPGVLATINRVLADSGANVVGQSLSTRGGLGYVVTDSDTALPDATLGELRSSPQTVWLRSWRADDTGAGGA